MNKILTAIFALTALLSVSADPIVVEEPSNDVGMIQVAVSTTNVIIAIPFKELGVNVEDVSVANIVKTTNLAVGDVLAVFTGTKDTYDTWTLVADSTTGVKSWQKNAAIYTLDATGALTVGSAVSANETRKVVGSGIWLMRTSDAKTTITVFGKHVDSPTSTATADAWNLVGNPTASAVTLDATKLTPADGDMIVMPDGLRYNYTIGKGDWWRNNPSGSGTIKGAPSIPAGTGLWYYPAGTGRTINWTAQ